MPARPFTVRYALFVPGLLLMCVGVWLTAFLFFLFLIGAPLFLVGLAMTWASDYSAGAKAAATVAPFAIWIGGVLVLLAIGPHAPSTTVLVPDGYRGPVVVVFNEPCAPPLPRQDGRRIAAVPADGIVLASDVEELDWPVLPRDDEYVAVDGQGRRLYTLPDLDYPPSGSDPAPVDSSQLGTLWHLGPTTGVSPDAGSEVWFMYQKAYVGSVRAWAGSDETLSDRITRRVRACRRAAGLPETGGPSPSEPLGDEPA